MTKTNLGKTKQDPRRCEQCQKMTTNWIFGYAVPKWLEWLPDSLRLRLRTRSMDIYFCRKCASNLDII